jgi:glucan endo-1,3-beta-D-glucosidase
MRFTTLAAALCLSASATATNYLGFNSGATKDDNTAKFKADFAAEFTTARNLQNAPGDFTAVRLYTNIQAYSQTNEPIEAFEAAIETNTSMLLGIWASGTTSIKGEIAALKTAIDTHGDKFTDLVIGISVGSEDLYRDSVTGVANKAGVGAGPQVILDFIKDFKSGIADTPLASKPVGHVDTWDVWPNATIKAVIDAIDFIGVNEFPYYQTGEGNSIKNSGQLFDKAYETVLSIAGDKPVWVTETGWPYTGPDWDEAEASVENAKYYWDEVGCRVLFGKTSVFWYALRDSNPANKPKFAITNNLSTKARFDLTCPTTFETHDESSSTSSSGSHSSTKSSKPSSTSGPVSSSTPTTASDGSVTTPTGGSSDTSSSPPSTGTGGSGSGASSIHMFSAVTYVALALSGGLFYLV